MRFASTTDRTARHALQTFAVAVAIWTAATIGYYWLLGPLGVEDGLNDAPVFYAAFYTAWAAVALFIFRRSHFGWLTAETMRHYVRPGTFLAVVLFGIAAIGIPSLPGLPFGSPYGPPHPFEMTSAYFLPKSAEILLQQLLIAAITIELKCQSVTAARLQYAVVPPLSELPLIVGRPISTTHRWAGQPADSTKSLSAKGSKNSPVTEPSEETPSKRAYSCRRRHHRLRQDRAV